MTRAFAAIVHGDLAYAWSANAGSLATFALVLGLAAGYAAQSVTGETYVARLWARPRLRRVVGGMILAVIVFSLVTNLDRHRRGEGPLRPRSWPSPPAGAPGPCPPVCSLSCRARTTARARPPHGQSWPPTLHKGGGELGQRAGS